MKDMSLRFETISDLYDKDHLMCQAPNCQRVKVRRAGVSAKLAGLEGQVMWAQDGHVQCPAVLKVILGM